MSNMDNRNCGRFNNYRKVHLRVSQRTPSDAAGVCQFMVGLLVPRPLARYGDDELRHTYH